MKKKLNLLMLTALCAYTSLSFSMNSNKSYIGSPDSVYDYKKTNNINNTRRVLFGADSSNDSLEDDFQPINPTPSPIKESNRDAITALIAFTKQPQEEPSLDNLISDEAFNQWFGSTRNCSPTFKALRSPVAQNWSPESSMESLSTSNEVSFETDFQQPQSNCDAIAALIALKKQFQEEPSLDSSISDEDFNQWFKSTHNCSPTFKPLSSPVVQNWSPEASMESLSTSNEISFKALLEQEEKDVIEHYANQWAEDRLTPANVQEYKDALTNILNKTVSQDLKQSECFKILDKTIKYFMQDYLEDNTSDFKRQLETTYFFETILKKRIPLTQKFASHFLPTIKPIKNKQRILGTRAKKPTTPEAHKTYKALQNIR